jgi:hypothetical protein
VTGYSSLSTELARQPLSTEGFDSEEKGSKAADEQLEGREVKSKMDCA